MKLKNRKDCTTNKVNFNSLKVLDKKEVVFIKNKKSSSRCGYVTIFVVDKNKLL